ncbi:MAG: allophanate hydrolase subunit 2 family protein [Proteobacteria bacterium]|nr:MAG: allophanate hydrolase subunit 2 family protein [Pseudomonadota bacterium]
MTITINKAGFMTTIQDGGRIGFGHLGIPQSGFMDRDSARLANYMVNNMPDEALLEVDVAGIIFTIKVSCSVAVVGAQAQVLVNHKAVNSHQCIHLNPGDGLEIEPLRKGMWTYVAFAGGLVCDSVLNSCSTLTVAKLGGYKGRRLQHNDGLSLQNPKQVQGRQKPTYKRPPHNSIHSLAVSRGPEYDWFTETAQRHIMSRPLTMTEHISRQGMKVTGPELHLKTKKDMPSTGLVPGSMQITPGGDYIITHRDSQTTGGYPRIVVLHRQALNQLAQVRPKETIYFYLAK